MSEAANQVPTERMNFWETVKYGASVLWTRHVQNSEYRARRPETTAHIRVPSALAEPIEISPSLVQAAYEINAVLLAKDERPAPSPLNAVVVNSAGMEEEFGQWARFDKSRWSWLFPTLKATGVIELKID